MVRTTMQLRRCALFLAAMVVVTELRGADIPWKVDTHGDFKNWEFQGNEAFSKAELVRGLDANISLIPAARPTAYLPTLVQQVEAFLVRGYQHHGFPDCEVHVVYDGYLQQLIAQIKEGPRYQNGVVEISGPEASLAEFVNKRLQGTSLAKVLGERPAVPWMPQNQQNGQPPQQDPDQNKLKWKQDEYADFVTTDQAIADRVKEILAEAGYMSPQIKVHRSSAPETLKVALNLAIHSGPPAMIAAIEVTGAERHTPQEIIDFLNLKQETPFRIHDLARWKNLLYESGRFAEQEVTSLPVNQGQPGQRILIRVAECPELPLLTEPLTEVDELLLKARESYPQFLEQAQEVRAVLHYPASAVAKHKQMHHRNDPETDRHHGLHAEILATHTGRVGLFCTLLNPEDQPLGSLILDNEDAAYQLTSTFTNHRLVLPQFNTPEAAKFVLTLSLQRVNHHEEGRRFGINFGIGASSDAKDQSDSGTSRLPILLTVSPAYLLAITRQPTSQVIYEKDRLILIDRQTRLELSRHSSQILSIQAGDERLTVFELTTGSGQQAKYAASLGESPEVTAVFGNSKSLLSDLMLFSADEIPAITEKWTGLPSDQLGRAKSVARIVQTLGRAWQESPPSFDLDAALKSIFYIPPAPGHVPSQLEGYGSLAMVVDNLLFARGSAPWQLGREAVALVAKQDRTAIAELERVMSSPQTGPLTCLAGAEAMRFVHPLLADLWARKGLERLDDGSIARDIAALTDTSTPLGNIVHQTAAFIFNLPLDDFQQLLEGTAGEELAGQLIRRVSAEEISTAELDQQIKLVGEAIWKTYGRSAVENALRRHVKEGETPLRLELPDAEPTPSTGRELPSRRFEIQKVEPIQPLKVKLR